MAVNPVQSVINVDSQNRACPDNFTLQINQSAVLFPNVEPDSIKATLIKTSDSSVIFADDISSIAIFGFTDKGVSLNSSPFPAVFPGTWFFQMASCENNGVELEHNEEYKLTLINIGTDLSESIPFDYIFKTYNSNQINDFSIENIDCHSLDIVPQGSKEVQNYGYDVEWKLASEPFSSFVTVDTDQYGTYTLSSLPAGTAISIRTSIPRCGSCQGVNPGGISSFVLDVTTATACSGIVVTSDPVIPKKGEVFTLDIVASSNVTNIAINNIVPAQDNGGGNTASFNITLDSSIDLEIELTSAICGDCTSVYSVLVDEFTEYSDDMGGCECRTPEVKSNINDTKVKFVDYITPLVIEGACKAENLRCFGKPGEQDIYTKLNDYQYAYTLMNVMAQEKKFDGENDLLCLKSPYNNKHYKDKYKIDCIKEYFKCKYDDLDFVDCIIDSLGFTNDELQDGIGEMIIDLKDCQPPFKID